MGNFYAVNAVDATNFGKQARHYFCLFQAPIIAVRDSSQHNCPLISYTETGIQNDLLLAIKLRLYLVVSGIQLVFS